MTARAPFRLALASLAPLVSLAPLAILLSACAPSEPTSKRAYAIAGGQLAAGTYRAVVAVASADELDGSLSLVCSGTLIASDAVLTAAHCFIGSPPRLRVFVGDDVSVAASGDVYEVVRHELHSLWSETTAPPVGIGQANDLALLFLDRTVQGVDPVALPSAAEVKAELAVRAQTAIIGFGAAEIGGASGVKQVAVGARVAAVGDFELAVSNPGEPQACEGDSGGPALLLMADDSVRLVGTASRASGSGTACNGGAVYTRVDSYVDFIRDAVPDVCVGAGCPGPTVSTDRGTTSDARPSINDGTSGEGGVGGTHPPRSSGCAVGGVVDLPPLWLIALLPLCWRRRRSRGRVRSRA